MADESVVYWPSDSIRYPDRSRGGQVFLQVQLVEQWVHRRVEQVAFLDDRTIRRQVSLDFELPAGPPATDNADADHYLVPLALLRKVPLLGFDLRDEGGSAVPVLTRHQNGDVAWSALVAYAEAIMASYGDEEELQAQLIHELRVIARGTPSEAKDAFVGLEQSDEAIVRHLMDDDVFVNLATDLGNSFLLLAVLPEDSPKRRVLKFSYIEDVYWEEISTAMRLGWEPTPFPFDCPAVDEGRSYHFEAEAPEGLEISHSEMWRVDESGSLLEELAFNKRSGVRSHLYPRDVEAGDSARVWVWLRPVVPGLIRAAFYFATIMAPLLAVIFLRLHDLRDDAATGLLLGLPGLVALAITRARENLMTTRLLLRLRALVSAVGFLPFAGALALVLGFEGWGLLIFWWILVAASFALLFVTGKSYIALRRGIQ